MPVPLAQLLTPQFRSTPHVMFSPDGFHPSAPAYAIAADALLRALCEALGEEVDLPPLDLAAPATAPVLGQRHTRTSVMSRLWRRPVPGPAPSSCPPIGND